MPLVTDPAPKYAITPKDAAGNAVDLSKFPTALTAITWSVDKPEVAVPTAAADGLSATLAPTTAGGTVVLTVSGTNVKGDVVSENTTVEFTVPVPVVTSLNLASVAVA